MASVSKSFTAVGVSNYLQVKHGDRFTYTVSGTFVGTWQIQSTKNNGLSHDVVAQGTGTATNVSYLVETSDSSPLSLRFKCKAFTSGTIVTSLEDSFADVPQAHELKDRYGVVVAQLAEGGIVRPNQKRIINVGAKAGTTEGFVVGAADDLGLLATCPASKTASTLVVPISGLKVGETITGFHLIGQIESAANEVTVDADLRKHTAAAADVTDASVGAITQLSAVADTIMSADNTTKASLTEVVGADETFYVLITATTGASTDIALQGVAVVVTEN